MTLLSSFSRTHALKLGILEAISKELRHNVNVLCRIKCRQPVDAYVCIGVKPIRGVCE